MSSDEGNDLEDLLGRVSRKLGWQNDTGSVETTFRKTSESAKHKKKKKSVRSITKKTPRKSRKDTSSSSDKENSVNGCNQHRNHHETESHVKFTSLPTDLGETLSKPEEKTERWASNRVTDMPLTCLNNSYITANAEDIIQRSHPESPDKTFESIKYTGKDLEYVDRNRSLFESATEILCLENETGIVNEKKTISHYHSTSESRSDNELEDHLTSLNKTMPCADIEDSVGFTKAEAWEKPLSVSSDEDDFAKETKISSVEFPSRESKDKPDMLFSPLQSYSETSEPIEWLLTPPPKDKPIKTNPVEKITMVTFSDSDSDSPCGVDVHTLSLSERLAKNFKKQKTITKSASKKTQLGNGAQARHCSSSEDSDQEKDGYGWRTNQKYTSTKESSTAKNPQMHKYDSDDDDFESFLHAIKSSYPPPKASKPRSPIVDEDQYEDSFIDDMPLDSKDSEDIFYHGLINSDKKSINKKKEQEVSVKKTPHLLNYRLPRFSDSDDADDVFATPKPPAVRSHKPNISSSSKKFTPVSSQRRDNPGSRQSDFLLSLATPKVGCMSSSPYVKDFKKQRETLTRKLFTIYNQTVFDNKLPSDFSIKWNNRLRKTAGYCYYTKTRLGGQCTSRIELSEKVCDSAERLRDTLIHELCHAACWLINGVNDGHGRFWKYWAAKANHAHPAIPVIKRCHNYEITTKYKYQCVTCKTTIGRHSKSIDTAKFCCAYCKGSIVLLPPLNKDGKVSKVRTPNKFAMFVKENYGSVKKGNFSMKHADIMRLLSQDFSKKATISV